MWDRKDGGRGFEETAVRFPFGMMWVLVESGAEGTEAGQGALAKRFTVHEAPDGRGLTSVGLEITA